MRIRIINANDWEKVYDLDKSIIRVGSQLSCDILLKDVGIQPLQMQIVRSGGQDVRYVMRFFAEDITITRGDQVYPVAMSSPYDVLDGDKISFSNYRLIINLEDERTRVRSSMHMMAEMFLSKRELSLESPIHGVIKLKNLGTDKPCQFKFHIHGIPEECLQSAPLPYLHPGASSSVGFIISHLQTKPAPGFHTVSLTLNAPDDYFGEVLEFNQDIYVNPVFKSEIVLEDDSEKLAVLNGSTAEKAESSRPSAPETPVIPSILESGMMNPDESVTVDNSDEKSAVRVLRGDSGQKGSGFEDDEEDALPSGYRKRKEKVVVVRHGGADGFDSEPEKTDSQNSSTAVKDDEKNSGTSETTAPSEKKKAQEEKPVQDDPLKTAIEKIEKEESPKLIERDEAHEADQKEDAVPEILAKPVKKRSKSKKAEKNREKTKTEERASGNTEPVAVEETPAMPAAVQPIEAAAEQTGNEAAPVESPADSQPAAVITDEKAAVEEPAVEEPAVPDQTPEVQPAAANEEISPSEGSAETEENKEQLPVVAEETVSEAAPEDTEKNQIEAAPEDSQENQTEAGVEPSKDIINNEKPMSASALFNLQPIIDSGDVSPATDSVLAGKNAAGTENDAKEETVEDDVPAFAALTGEDGTQIRVFSTGNSFDDFGSEEVSEPEEKPKETQSAGVRVMKGGGFDE